MLFSQNRYLSAILEATQDGFWVLDDHGVLQDVNDAYCRMSGYSRDELLGMRITDLDSYAKQAEIHDRMQRIIEKGAETFEARHRRKDGSEIDVEISTTWLDNNIHQFVCFCRDITERKKAERATRHERDIIERLMETSPAGITHLNADGKILYANKRAEEILGLRLSEIAHRTYDAPEWKIIDFDGRPFPNEKLPFQIVKKTGKPVYDVHHAIESPNGRRIFLSINAAPLLDADGVMEGMVASIEDITEKYLTERNYQMLFREMMDGFALHEMVYDALGNPVDYRFLNVNPAFERLTGLNAGDLIGKTVMEVMPKTETYWIEKYGEVVRTGTPISFENYSQELERYFQVSAFKPAENQFACIFVDVTERKQAEKALAESTDRFHKVFNSQLDAIFILNHENPPRILESNTAALKIFGYAHEELIGQAVDILYVNEKFREEFQAALSPAIRRDGFFNNFEFVMKRKDGAVFPSEHTVLELKNNVGERTGWVSIVRDLTERKKNEARLRQSQKMESIGTLAGGIAHDFNNILFPIIGMAELLMDDLPPDGIERENAEEIFKAARRGGDLVKQILEFSRQSEDTMMAVHIQDILREALKLSRSSIPINIEMTHSLQDDCGPVMANPTQIHQIAMNLITNAYHAIEPDSGNIHIELCQIEIEETDGNDFLMDGEYVQLRITDTGCGIDPDIADKIFEPYFTTKGQGKGTGLGLAVVYGIVKAHGGDIKIYSEPGTGTTCNVYLPLMQKEAKVTEETEINSQQTGSERILLVDDEAPILRFAQQMLERLGYAVTTHSSSIDALNAFEDNPDAFDLVITDMTMPKMTGEQLSIALIRIKQDIPIIICTGFSEKINNEKAKALGIKGFLMKPIIKSELSRIVRQVLESQD